MLRSVGATTALGNDPNSYSGIASIVKMGKTNDSAVDGILFGKKWASNTLTYSFPTSAVTYEYTGEAQENFQPLSDAQKAAMVSILSQYSAVANLHFVEVDETSSQHATLRFAESDATTTAYTYYPSETAQGGDIWFNDSTHWYDNPVPGNYAYLTMLHEMGHAVGLKHAQDKTVYGALPKSISAMSYTVMSYQSYVGAPTSSYFNAPTSYAQTLMSSDISALQKMYGANYTTHAGDTVYSWLPDSGSTFINGISEGATAGNKIFMTVWDGGGNDIYDLSHFTTDVSIDLNPGKWTTTSQTQLANLSGDGQVLAPGNISNAYLYKNNLASLIENAIGGDGNDKITGNSANNTLYGGAGNDTLNGGTGSDRLIGGQGFDKLTGGSGKDTFVFTSLADAGDTITDFKHGTDHIEISGIGFDLDYGTGLLSKAYFDAKGVATHASAEFIFDSHTHQLLFDPDGTGGASAITVATLTSVKTLAANDIWLV
jgi:serralysin